jgi:spermidine/putrescine transport system substrate-binding protein
MIVWCRKAGLNVAAIAGLLAAVATGPAHAEDGELTVFDWPGYEDPGFHPLYTDKHGDSPTFAFYADEEEALQKLRAGFKADVAHPCSQSISRWREAGVIEPIDPARITDWNNIMPAFKAMPGLVTTADGKAWLIPFEWGSTAILYNSDKVTADDVKSVKVFADPRFEGRIALPDNVDDAYALASLSLGIKDWTAMTDEQFAAASEFLRAAHKNARLYWAEGTELAQAFATGEIDLAWSWNEVYSTLKKEGRAVGFNTDAAEGISTWVCGYVLLAGGPGNKDKAYDYLNAIIDQRVSPYIVSEWGYGHSNAAGMASVDKTILAEGGLADAETFSRNTLFQSPLPENLRQKMIAEFEKIKAGY